MVRSVLSFIGGIFTLCVMASLSAILVLTTVFQYYNHDLPDHERLTQYNPPTISRIYSTEGKIIDEFARERRLFIPISEVPDLVKYAFISAEDKNFYTHNGYDIRGITAAGVEAIRSRGKNIRGASTITQQVMKNFLLSGERTGERKIKELILANRVENILSKDRILELYLNEIFLGQNSYGIAAAAQTYFNKPLVSLAPHEAAMLAAMPQAPSKYHPVRAKKRLLQRRNYVLREMWQNGYLEKATYENALKQPLETVQNGDFPSFRAEIPPRSYFTDEIRRQLSGVFGEEEFFTGGLSIRATLDPELQAEAEKALRAELESYDHRVGIWEGTGKRVDIKDLKTEESWRKALKQIKLPRDIPDWHLAVVLDFEKDKAIIGVEGISDTERDGAPSNAFIPSSDVTWARLRVEGKGRAPQAKTPKDILNIGDITYVTAAVNPETGAFEHWSLRQIPKVQGAFMAMDANTGRVLALQGGFSYQESVFDRATQAFRQPGSSLKPIVYAAALDSGFTPATIVVDAPIEVDTPEGLWRPKNSSDKFYGPTTIRTGIEQSRNLMTIRIASELGMDNVASYTEEFGIYDKMNPYLANALGAQETSLYRMVAAYAMLANGGEKVKPTMVDRIQDHQGRTIYRHDRRVCIDCKDDTLPFRSGPHILSLRERVIDPVTAYQVTSMMKGVVERGTARNIDLPVPIAGKTGTTNEARDVWFIGYTSNIVAGCYIGHDQPRPLLKGSSGGKICGPVFENFMRSAIAKYGGGPFRVPEGSFFVNIDRYNGNRLPNTATGENVVKELFRQGREPGFGNFVDGGFVVGSDLPLFESGSSDRTTSDIGAHNPASGPEKEPPSSGTNFNSISSGGLY